MFRVKSRRSAARAAVTAVAAVLMAGTALAVPAQAQPAQPYGTVITPEGVYERQFPSTDSSVRGSLPQGAQTGLRCKVRAQNIDGNTLWYLLRARSTWVSARYVVNTGYVPYCKDIM